MRVQGPQDDGSSADEGPADDGGIEHAGFGLFFGQTVGVGFAVGEFKQVGRRYVGQEFFERAGVGDLFNASAGRESEMIAAIGAEAETVFDLLAIDHIFALRATEPEALGDPLFVCCRSLLDFIGH